MLRRISVLVLLVAACGKSAPPPDLGNLACWGNNTLGQLGEQRSSSFRAPQRVDGFAGATAVALTSSALCAFTASGVQCRGELPPLVPPAQTPTAVPALAGAAELEVASLFGCVRAATGTVSCWGSNLLGELGRGDAPDPTAKVPMKVDGEGNVEAALPAGSSGGVGPVTGLTDATALTVGSSFACAIRADKSVACWGGGANGQLGDGRSGDGTTSPVPAPVPGLAGVTAIDAGSAAVCAIASGDVYCWGLLGERYGGGTTWTSPTKIEGITDAVEVRVVESLACARTRAGAVACWDKAGKPSPVEVGKAVQLVGGFRHHCVRTEAGEVRCWGDDLNGQLGGSTRSQPVPGLAKVTALFAGGSSTCVLLGT